MNAHERETEYMVQLFEAVLSGDLGRAQSTANEMAMLGIHRGLVMAAKRRATPLPACEPLAKPISLPQPGADPRQVFGGPVERPIFGAIKRKGRRS